MNLNGIQSYENFVSGVRDAGANAEGISSAKAANAAALGSAAEGSVVTGEVISVSGNTVQLKLPDAQIVTARLEADVALSAGQSMAFTVKSNTGSQIALTPMFGSAAVNPSAIKALTQASIMINDTTLTMAETMMEEGLSVNKNSLMAMNRLVGKFPGADAADIVSMTSQGIPVTDENLEQYALYKNNQHQLMSLAEDISDSFAELSGSLTPGELSELSEVFTRSDGNAYTGELLDNLRTQLEDKMAAGNAFGTGNTGTGILGAGADFLKALNGQGLNIDTSFLSGEEAAGKMTEMPEEQAESVINKVLENSEEQPLLRLIGSDQAQSLADTLSLLGLSSENAAAIAGGSMDPMQALSYIQSALKLSESEFTALGFSEAEAKEKTDLVETLAKSNITATLLKESVVKDFSLKAEEGLTKQDSKQLYERMLRDSDKALQLLDKFSASDSEMARDFQSLKSNISFMNQMNEMFTYMQLPLQLSGENGNGDLYVYTNKKNLAKKEGDITALLHLEMDELGTMDIHVTLSGENNVKTNFVLQDEETLDFVEENIHILDERLQKRGYNVNISTSVKDKAEQEENPAIKAMLGKGESTRTLLLSKYSFDVKA